MKNTVLTLATLAALSSGQMGEVGNLINGAEQMIGTAVVSAATDGVSHLGQVAAGQNGSINLASAQNGVVYAKANPYAIRTTPYNVSSVKFSNNGSGFGGKSFGF